MAPLPMHHVPGDAATSGFTHGRAIADLLTPSFLDAYTRALRAIIGVDVDDLRDQSRRWLGQLPSHFQEEITSMGAGAGVEPQLVTEFLCADIARPSRVEAEPETTHSTRTTEPWRAPIEPTGPMCSAMIARLDDGATWIGRNCDWLVPTLMRGTAAVIHETPHRIPVMAVGIRGDIDVDTGINAERLWLHVHTLAAVDDPPPDRTCISWLFWAREALEVCASLDDLERFIAGTGRDRGVYAIAGDGKTDEAAIFECTRSGHVRHDVDPARPACVTNHSLDRDARDDDDDDERRGAPGGTLGRQRAMRVGLRERPPRRGPDDIIDLLASPEVEMWRPRWLRTIYSAVVRPRDSTLWFAAGHADGTPAASGGQWAPLTSPWGRTS